MCCNGELDAYHTGDCRAETRCGVDDEIRLDEFVVAGADARNLVVRDLYSDRLSSRVNLRSKLFRSTGVPPNNRVVPDDSAWWMEESGFHRVAGSVARV